MKTLKKKGRVNLLKTLILAEKPSQAQDIAKGLGTGFKRAEGYLENSNYVVTWAYGHLVELVEPQDYDEKYKAWSLAQLPILPSAFKYRVTKNGEKQFKVIKALLGRKDVARVVNSTDPGREGELIARLILQLAGNKKPVSRFWTSKALTSEAVQEGMNNLKPASDYDGLYFSAMARQHADWIVGINGSRVCSIKAGQLYPIGRVQTPTLALLVKREEEIRKFKPRDYWNVEAFFTAGNEIYKGLWFRGSESEDDALEDEVGNDLSSQYAISKREQANNVQHDVEGRAGMIEHIKSAIKRESPPLLFSLTVLQQEANKIHGYPADKTLSLVQSLYEKKLCTYPRTESQYLNEEMEGECKEILRKLQESAVVPFVIAKCVVSERNKRVFNAKKLTDHHALIPTGRISENLSNDEMNLFNLIVKRFISSFYPDFKYKHTVVVTFVNEHLFKTTGKTVIDVGWKKIYGVAEKDSILPSLIEGAIVDVAGTKVIDKQTTPPARYTDASILQAMTNASRFVTDPKIKTILKETAGIGTSATRASILQGLESRQYIERKGKALVPTQKAFFLIDAIKDEKISDIGWTGLWEQELDAIAMGQAQADSFMDSMKNYIVELVGRIKESSISATTSESVSTFSSGNGGNGAKKIVADDSQGFGICPACGGQVRVGQKAYYCGRWKDAGCRFSLYKNNLERLGKKSLSPAMVKKLLEGKEVKFSNLKNKEGRSFDAKGYLSKKENHWGIHLIFTTNNKKDGGRET